MPNAATRLMRQLRRLWVAPELGLLYHRRERRVRLLTSAMMMFMGVDMHEPILKLPRCRVNAGPSPWLAIELQN